MNFEKASRLKVRFDTARGFLTTEDLWDLPLTSARGPNLNDIAKNLNKELKSSGEEDFVTKSNKADEVLQLKFDLVKHVIDVRLAENAEARALADKKAKKERLLELIAKKQDASLEAKSLEELQEMVAGL